MSFVERLADLGVQLGQQPLLIFIVVLLPLVMLAIWKDIFPGMRLVFVSVIPAVFTILLIFQFNALPFVIGLDLIIIVLLAFDLFSIPVAQQFTASRQVPLTASIRKKHPVELTIANIGKNQRWYVDSFGLRAQDSVLEIRDDIPNDFEAKPSQLVVELPATKRAILRYELLASRRGAFDLECVYLRVSSRLGFWKRNLTIPCHSKINVYPDMKQLAEFELLARTNRLSLMGVRRTRRVGQDNEFERLRDYSLDDNYKHIDWRSTARRQKLTVRDFQTTQSQRVIFMIDCGRMMTTEAAQMSMLDHAFNSMLMLSYIALRRGDSVGLLCFSDRIHSYVPPKGGTMQMNHLLRACFDRFPELVESHYEEAFLHISQVCRKRSLVVMVTNVIDELNATQIHQYLSTIGSRHLPLAVLLRDRPLFTIADSQWSSDTELYSTAAAADILCWRQDVLRDLQRSGVLALDVFPEEMTAPLINQYLKIKARHLL